MSFFAESLNVLSAKTAFKMRKKKHLKILFLFNLRIKIKIYTVFIEQLLRIAADVQIPAVQKSAVEFPAVQ